MRCQSSRAGRACFLPIRLAKKCSVVLASGALIDGGTLSNTGHGYRFVNMEVRIGDHDQLEHPP